MDNPIHNILKNLNLTIVLIQIISAIKLIMGGAAILLIMVINHKNEIRGTDPNIPFDIIILRVELRR